MAGLAAATSSSSYTPSLSFGNRITDVTSSQFPPFLFSPKPNFSKNLKLTSQSLPPPIIRILSPVRFFRTAAASEDLQAPVESELEGELDLSESETDQLLQQEHEHELHEEEDGDEGQIEGKEPAPPEDGRLYVGNLPFNITSLQLADIFVEAGAVRSAEIIYDRVTDRSRGFAFVTMATVADAETAIRMFDSSQIGGRTVRVNFPEVPRGGEKKVLEPKIQASHRNFMDTPNKIYAGNLSWSVTSEALGDIFSDQPGFLSAKVVFERHTGRSRGFGFVSFSSPEEARAALAVKNGVELDGRALRLNMASEKARSSSPPSEQLNSEDSLDQSEVLSGVSS